MIVKLLRTHQWQAPLLRYRTTIKLPYEPIHITGQAAAAQKAKGHIYDKKPFKFLVEKGKIYYWCTCGWSHHQPFCDRTHKNGLLRIQLKPVRFIAPETKEIWFCNCKQTSQRPFCDGTHRQQQIQDAVKS